MLIYKDNLPFLLICRSIEHLILNYQMICRLMCIYYECICLYVHVYNYTFAFLHVHKLMHTNKKLSNYFAVKYRKMH